MKALIFKLLVIASAVVFGCCDHAETKMSIGSPKFITDFPKTLKIKSGNSYKIDEIGINSLKFIDSLLIVGHFDHWSIYSSDGKTKYGDCLKLGKGPNEFNIIPRCSASLFENNNDSIYAYIDDRNRNRILEFNLSEFISSGDQHIVPTIESKYLRSDVWDVTPLSETETLLTIPTKKFDGFERRILLKDSLIKLPITEELDALSVKKGEEEINLLSKVLRFNRESGKIVEAMLSLNQINIYSKDGTWGKTICVGNSLDDIRKIESTIRLNRKYTYETLSTWDWGFGAVYLGQKELDWQKQEKCNSEIQFFDWNGNPLFNINLNESISAFDISPDMKHLLVVTRDDELKDYLLPDKILTK